MTQPDDTGLPPRRLPAVWTTTTWLVSAALLWLGCTALYFLTAPGRLDMIDGGIRYEVTSSLLEAGTPAIRNAAIPGVPGRLGQHYSYYPIGSSLIAVPFVWAADRLTHGSLEARQFAFSLVSVPFASGVVALMFLIFGRLGCLPRRALAYALVVAFCTPLWVYAGSSFDTAPQAFWLTLGAWGAVEAFAANSWRWALLSGAAFAALVNIQETYVVLTGCVADVAPISVRTIRERLSQRVVHIIGALVLLGLAVVLAYNAFKFGHPLDTGRTTVLHPLVGHPVIGFVGLFFSPAKSVLLYSPTYLCALLGLRRLIRVDGRRFALIGACVAIHVALTSTLKFWAGEWAWGPRYLIASLPLVCIGLPFWATGATQRRVLGGLCGIGLLVQVMAISVDHQRYYFERSLQPFFWLDEMSMYRDSPLLARPSELVDIVRGRDWQAARALVPGPRPFSMTSPIFGPSTAEEQARAPQWMRGFLVFSVPRPWPLWSRYLPSGQRPGRTGLMAMGASLVALVAFAALFARTRVSDGALWIRASEDEQVVQS